MEATLQIAAGSVIGRLHANAGRNNQDAFDVSVGPEVAVAVVCDGCGSGARSEVGAVLGARLLTAALRTEAAAARREGRTPDLERAREAVLARLRALADGAGGAVEDFVHEHLLFTVVGALLTAEQTWAFSIGDGVLVVNGEKTALGPYPDNAPPYLGYALLAPEAPGFRFRVHGPWPTAQVEALLIGTDGAEELEQHGHPLSQFWEDERCFGNRDGLRRKLAVLNRARAGHAPPLADDTTLVVLRRSARH